MKVFISWSGQRSRQVAELLNDWLQCVLQALDPWMSSKDIDRGALWFTEITQQLSITSMGIVCLTMENRNKPWILFEAGALAKGLSSNRVCTLLVDLQATDLQNPLAQFNHTLPTKEGLFSLVQTINDSLKEKALKPSVLKTVFETYWLQFSDGFSQALAVTHAPEKVEERKELEVSLEILSVVRELEKRVKPNKRSERCEEDEKVQEVTASRRITHLKLIDEVVSLWDQGIRHEEVRKLLRKKGYDNYWINWAIKHAIQRMAFRQLSKELGHSGKN
jgi:hypothetical protein